MLQKAPREYRLEGPLKLRVSRPLEKEEARFEFATDAAEASRLATVLPDPAPKNAVERAARSRTEAG